MQNLIEKGDQKLSSYILVQYSLRQYSLWSKQGKFLWVTIVMALGIHTYSTVTRKNASHHPYKILHSFYFQQIFYWASTEYWEQNGPHP